jgi:hypothetical protein
MQSAKIRERVIKRLVQSEKENMKKFPTFLDVFGSDFPPRLSLSTSGLQLDSLTGKKKNCKKKHQPKKEGRHHIIPR